MVKNAAGYHPGPVMPPTADRSPIKNRAGFEPGAFPFLLFFVLNKFSDILSRVPFLEKLNLTVVHDSDELLLISKIDLGLKSEKRKRN